MMSTYPLLPLRMWNMRPWRASPLMRPSYRLEAMLHIGAVVLVALAIPLAAALGTATYTARLEQTERAAASVHTAQATLSADADPKDEVYGAVAVRASWIVDGREHTGDAITDISAKAGDHVTVWVSANGEQTAKPAGRAAAMPDAIALAVGAFGLFAAFILVMWHAVGWIFDRRRRETWAREWRSLADAKKWHQL